MKVEILETNKKRIIFDVSAETFETGLKHSYNKNKSRINVAGFRKGKAPRKLIEVQFGKEIFYEDAIDFILPKEYDRVKEELELDVVAQPEFTDFNIRPDNTVQFTVEVYTKPVVTLGDYSSFTYKKNSNEATEEEILAQIEDALEKNSREISIIDRAIMDGDIVIINFKGFVDGVPFENGEGKDYQLKIGSNTFIKGFEEQLIGHEVGDDVQVSVRFPDEYHANDLAGRDAVFDVEILEIKVMEKPELDDEFASDVSEFDTLDEYKESIAKNIIETKTAKAIQLKESELIEQLVNCADMDVPQIMIENHIDELIHEFKHSITDRGIPFEMYLQYMGTTEEGLRQSYQEIAANQIKGRLALEALADAENIEATDEDIKNTLTNIIKDIDYDIDKLITTLPKSEKKRLVQDTRIEKALKFLIDNSAEEM